jgi:hypothetical protein
LRAHTGTYRNERHDWTLRIELHDGRLHAHTEGEPARELVPLNPSLFAMPGGLGPLRFVRGRDDRVEAVVSIDVDDLTLLRVAGSGAEP